MGEHFVSFLVLIWGMWSLGFLDVKDFGVWYGRKLDLKCVCCEFLVFWCRDGE